MAVKVSVLMTSYNLVDYIDESIGSVVKMEFPFSWELIIGDDGSDDGTVGRIEKWIERYPDNIKLIKIERSREKVKTGSRAARNRALLLEKAEGEYVNYLDGDDCFLGTEKFVRQVEALDASENSDCSCCAHNIDVYTFSDNQHIPRTKVSIPSQKLTVQYYWKSWAIHSNTLLFRRECKDLMLQPLLRNYMNDNFITFLALQKGKMLYLPGMWARYNMTGSGLWTGHTVIYGTFRNIQLLDLELYLRPDMERIIYHRHGGDIKKIRHEYRSGMESDVSPLFEELDANIFNISYLLYKVSDLSLSEKRKKLALYLKLDYFRTTDMLLRNMNRLFKVKSNKKQIMNKQITPPPDANS